MKAPKKTFAGGYSATKRERKRESQHAISGGAGNFQLRVWILLVCFAFLLFAGKLIVSNVFFGLIDVRR